MADSEHSGASEIAQRWCCEGTADLEQLAPREDDRKISRIQLSARRPETVERVVFFGPWVGEFGWLVSRWQGGVRKEVAACSEAYVIVMGDPGCHVLFEYADEYWCTPPFVARLGLTRDMTGWREKRAARVQRALRAAIGMELDALGTHVGVIEPRQYAVAEQAHIRLAPPAAAELELASLSPRPPARLVCLFPRKRAHNPAKNWPPACWEQLAKHLHRAHGYHVVVCGGDDDTADLQLDARWALDLTQIPLERRLGLTLASLARADVAVASESGGCQLALLAGTPTVVMGGPRWRTRVSEDENYLRTPCVFLEHPRYAHRYEDVEAAVTSLIAETPSRTRFDADAASCACQSPAVGKYRTDCSVRSLRS